MNCFDCAADGGSNPAVAVCAHCGAAICTDHANVTDDWLTHIAMIDRPVRVEPAARVVRCGTCQAAQESANKHAVDAG